ncbi:MAG: rhamnan synthesis F family protein [Promicromonosporaceae bacterium]|nr:rhamnan synthesis F family protein [Promicromonosporaceae bacterium]
MRALIYSIVGEKAFTGDTAYKPRSATERQIPGYVNRQLSKLSSLFDTVVIVGDQTPRDLPRDTEMVIGTFAESNFLAWKAGLEHLGWNALARFDAVTLMTSQTFGPIGDPQHIFAEAAHHSGDFWGIIGTAGTPDSLFFSTYRNSVITSSTFREFWDKLTPQITRSDPEEYAQLAADLTTVGFQNFELFPISPENSAQVAIPDQWAVLGVPFLRISDLVNRRDFVPYALDYLDLGGFGGAVAAAHLSQLGEADARELMGAKQRNYAKALVARAWPDHKLNPPNLPPETSPPRPDAKQSAANSPTNDEPAAKVAVHIHAHYPELLDEFFIVIRNYRFAHDLFLTTDSGQAPEVTAKLAQYGLTGKVIAVPNLGRDLYPLFQLFPKLNQYEVIGHFHTKMTKHDPTYVGQSWREELINMLVKPAAAIVSEFQTNPELGLVIADVPTFFRYNRSVIPESEARLVPLMTDLWNRMNLGREIDFGARQSFVMSYGTFFWARRDAIAPLFSLDISKDVPEEPIPINYTILHAIERILVYVIWGAGYDFAISENRYLTVFADEPAPVASFLPAKTLLRQKVARRLPISMKDALRPILSKINPTISSEPSR